jgi:hypothetical protein
MEQWHGLAGLPAAPGGSASPFHELAGPQFRSSAGAAWRGQLRAAALVPWSLMPPAPPPSLLELPAMTAEVFPFPTRKPGLAPLPAEPPIVRGWLSPCGGYVEIRCPHCGEAHTHGAGSIADGSVPHRVAHCGDRTPRELACLGYVIELLAEDVPRALRAEAAAPAGRIPGWVAGWPNEKRRPRPGERR